MKSLYAHERYARTHRSVMFLKFFFSARGVEKEKTMLGLYLALMHDYLQQSSNAMADFLPTYVRRANQRKKTSRKRELDPSSQSELKKYFKMAATSHAQESDLDLEQDLWEVSDLQDSFHRSIETNDLQPIQIFIDALDECDEQQVRDFLALFEQSVERAQSAGRSSKSVAAAATTPESRYAQKTASNLRSSVTTMPIAHHVQKALGNFPAGLSTRLEDSILRSARGVFLWVVLVIKRLRKAADQGKGETELLEQLSAMSSELIELFDQILLDRESDADDQQYFRRLLQWTFCSLGNDIFYLGNLQQSFKVYLSMIYQAQDQDDRSRQRGTDGHSEDQYLREQY